MNKIDNKKSKIYILAIISFSILSWARWFCWNKDSSKDIAALIIYNVLLIAILIFLIGKAEATAYENIIIKIVIMAAILMFPMFLDGDSFGKIELYLGLIFLLAFWCMLSSRSNWIVFPLGFIGILFESNFALRYLPFMLMAWYFCFVKNGKATDKITFYTALIFDGGLFIYKEFALIVIGDNKSSALLIDKATKESNLQTIVAFIVIIPLLLLASALVYGIFKQASIDLKVALIITIILVVFSAIVKRDYGMLIYQTLSGFLMLFALMLVNEKENIQASLSKTIKWIEEKIVWWQIIYIYVLMMMPLRVDSISNSLKWIVTIFNA